MTEKKDCNQIKVMTDTQNIRLFSSLCVKKTYKGALSSAQEIDMLFRIASATSPITPLKLSQYMGISKTMVSRLLDSLEKKEYITKEKTKNDKRSYFVNISKKGREQLKKMYFYYSEPLQKLKSGLGEKNYKKLLELIKLANDTMLQNNMEE